MSGSDANDFDTCVDVEVGLGENLCEAELPRPLRWNQPAVVIIACCIIIGVLGSGVGYAIRCPHSLWTLAIVEVWEYKLGPFKGVKGYSLAMLSQ